MGNNENISIMNYLNHFYNISITHVMKNGQDEYLFFSVKYMTVQIHCHFEWLCSILQQRAAAICYVVVFLDHLTQTNQSAHISAFSLQGAYA